MTDRVFTVGHSTRAVDEVAALARAHGIEAIADVRRFPRGRRQPQWSRANLERALPAAGLRYVWLGEELGGFVEGDYEDYMRTPPFRDGLVRLERLARATPTAVMCAEADPARCHRRFIARALVERGWSVTHVIDERRAEPEPLSLFG